MRGWRGGWALALSPVKPPSSCLTDASDALSYANLVRVVCRARAWADLTHHPHPLTRPVQTHALSRMVWSLYAPRLKLPFRASCMLSCWGRLLVNRNIKPVDRGVPAPKGPSRAFLHTLCMTAAHHALSLHRLVSSIACEKTNITAPHAGPQYQLQMTPPAYRWLFIPMHHP